MQKVICAAGRKSLDVMLTILFPPKGFWAPIKISEILCSMESGKPVNLRMKESALYLV